MVCVGHLAIVELEYISASDYFSVFLTAPGMTQTGVAELDDFK
jgi:hypothetical protein